jgi:hypothetical protein
LTTRASLWGSSLRPPRSSLAALPSRSRQCKLSIVTGITHRKSSTVLILLVQSSGALWDSLDAQGWTLRDQADQRLSPWRRSEVRSETCGGPLFRAAVCREETLLMRLLRLIVRSRPTQGRSLGSAWRRWSRFGSGALLWLRPTSIRLAIEFESWMIRLRKDLFF